MTQQDGSGADSSAPSVDGCQLLIFAGKVSLYRVGWVTDVDVVAHGGGVGGYEG